MSRSKRARRFRIASVTCLAGALAVLGIAVFRRDFSFSPGGPSYFLGAGLTLMACAVGFQLASRSDERSAGCEGKPCVNCGYDLRGNTSGICPECGGLAHYKRSHP